MAVGRGRGERGTVSVVVVVLTFAFLLAAGLVLDGGRLVAARLVAADVAGQAARAGAQEVVGIRGGEPALDGAAATAAAHRVLAAAGASGSVAVSGSTITVTARTQQSMLLLGLVGIDQRTVAATATARAEEGS